MILDWKLMNGEHCTDATSPNNDPLFVAALDNDDASGLGFFILSASIAVDNDFIDNYFIMKSKKITKNNPTKIRHKIQKVEQINQPTD